MTVLLLSGEVALRVGCFLSMIMMVSIAAWSVWNTLQEGVRYLNRLHQIPCSRCVYFTGDYRLKCPVHPIIALTEEAIACRDYEARKKPVCPASCPNFSSSSKPTLALSSDSKMLAVDWAKAMGPNSNKSSHELPVLSHPE